MSILELWTKLTSWLSQYGGLGLVILLICMSFVQIVPIKLNPWSAVAKLFSKMVGAIGSAAMKESTEQMKDLQKSIESLHKELQSDVADLDRKIDNIAASVDENEIDRLRWDILSFTNSCQRGENHTQNEFDHTFDANDKYHTVLARTNQTNGKVDREIGYLRELYAEKQETNSFLV